MSDRAPGRNLRFAVFEVDLHNGELRKHGIKVKLQDQPFQVLAMLLAANGEIVTREELRAKLWPADTFVDFDTGLNTAVKRLRDALGDNAESPRYVETLPRKGYRFIYPVNNGRRGVRRLAKILVPTLLLILVAAGLAGFNYLRPRPALTEKDVIVLADFDNRTGEPVFDNTLRTALAIDLEQSPFLSVMPDLKMGEILKQMKRARGDSVTPELGREICLRTSNKALLAGSISTIGRHYALQLRATDCQTGNNLASAAAEAESREKVLASLDRAATSLRSKLGESLTSIQKYARPLPEVTTSSLEALRYYSEGIRVRQQSGLADAVPFFGRALELDPDFATAHLYLFICYSNLGQPTLANEHISRAFALRDRVIEPEKYWIANYYYRNVTGELPKAVDQLQVGIRRYPRREALHGSQGTNYQSLGQHEDALAEYLEEVRLVPGWVFGYWGLSREYIALDKLDEAEVVVNQAFAHKLDNDPFLHYSLYLLAFLRNDEASMQQQLNWAIGKPGVGSLILHFGSETQIYYGRLAKARQISRAAEASAIRDKATERAALFQARNALYEVELGNPIEGRQSARAALALSRARDVRVLAAAALSGAGDFKSVHRLSDALNQDFRLDTLIQNYWLPAIRAQIELEKARPKRAIELLQSTSPYELASPYEFGANISMYPVYVRGQAYLAAGDGTSAAAEFQKILDHRGLVLNNVTGALAHLYLGRARVLEARSLEGAASEEARKKARAAYQDFLTLWKDADPDIPILKQAKAEYAKLQ